MMNEWRQIFVNLQKLGWRPRKSHHLYSFIAPQPHTHLSRPDESIISTFLFRFFCDFNFAGRPEVGIFPCPGMHFHIESRRSVNILLEKGEA